MNPRRRPNPGRRTGRRPAAAAYPRGRRREEPPARWPGTNARRTTGRSRRGRPTRAPSPRGRDTIVEIRGTSKGSGIGAGRASTEECASRGRPGGEKDVVAFSRRDGRRGWSADELAHGRDGTVFRIGSS